MEAIGDDGTLSLEKEKTIGEVENGYTYFRDGDVTVAKITPCFENGKGALMWGLANGIGFGTTELIVARPRTGEVLGAYLHYLFISTSFRKLGESHMYGAGGQKRVPDDFVRNFATAVPPISEQTLIIGFLDRETAKIDALMKEQRRLIELLREKRQAVISHAVTKGLNLHASMKPSGIEWLGDVPEHWTTPPLYTRYEAVLGKMLDAKQITGTHPIPYLRNADVQWDRVNVEDLPVIDIEPDEFDRFTLRSGDILVCEGGAGVGQTAIWQGELDRCAFQKAIHRLRPHSSNENPRFFYYCMCYAVESGIVLAAGSSTIPHLTGEKLRAYRFPCPPPEEQSAIVAFLDNECSKLEALTAEAQGAIDLLQERRTALISAAVTGKIDVRGLAESEAA